MKTLFFYPLLVLLVFTGIKQGKTSVSEEIIKANKAGKTVFLVVTEPGISGSEKALDFANQAHKKASKTTVIKMNRSDEKNKNLVTKYRLAKAPLPLILVIDKNGIVAGGLILSQASADKLIQLIPSPKYSEILKALNKSKSIFLVVYKESMLGKNKAFENCKEACKKMNNKSVFVTVDMNKKSETKLLTQLKINTLSNEPVTYVINNKGQITGTFKGTTNINKLVLAATKVASGCCPGGSKKGCGPTK